MPTNRPKHPSLTNFVQIVAITVNMPSGCLTVKNKERKNKIPSGPKPKYQNKVLLTVLKRLWFATDQMCSKKLKAAIALWLPFYEQGYGCIDDGIKTKLYGISPSTIDRLLKPVKIQFFRIAA